MRLRLVLVTSLLVAISSLPSAQRPPAPTGPRINALIVSGGGCHDYPLQGKVLVDAVSKALPVDWTVAIQGGRGTTGEMPIFRDPNWAKGFDIVVHNECFADATDETLIKRITAAHKGGPPAIVIHCAMHTFRASHARHLARVPRRHDQAAHQVAQHFGESRGTDHPVMRGFKPDWVTPIDELYVIDKFWPTSRRWPPP